MSKTFRPWPVDQAQLLPPSVSEFVPAGHMAHFVRDLVREQLDLSAITEAYGEARGYSTPITPLTGSLFHADPHSQAHAWRTAMDIRGFVSAVLEQSALDGSSSHKEWSAWALSEADRLDPVKQGVLRAPEGFLTR